MEGVETLTEAINRLIRCGYTENLMALEGSLLVGQERLKTLPEDYRIDEVVRFEGDTNLEDESVLFALSNEKLGIRGIYIAAYGPQMDTADLEVVQKLRRHSGAKDRS